MAKKKVFTRESLLADAELFLNDKFSKTNMTIDWMDAYVAKVVPEKAEEWINYCVSVPMVKRTIGGAVKEVKDSKIIRNYFIATFFPSKTEEAKEKEKEDKKALRAAEKAEKEAEKNLSPEEKLRKKLAKLAAAE